MAYITQLKWQNKFNDYSDEQQKILLGLSHDQYKWRTKERLNSITGLDPKTLDSELADLISKNIIRPSFSKSRKVIFGLRERVG